MRRVLARTLRLLLALATGLVLLAAAALVFFTMDPGEALLKRFLLARINEQIEGRVTAADLSFGGDSLELAAVHLADPEGKEVLALGRLRVDLELTSLLRGRFTLDRLSAGGVRVALWRTPQGEWSLARALAAREPSAEPGRLPDLGIEQIELEAAQFQLQLPSPRGGAGPGSERVHARDLGLKGWLRIRDERLEADLWGQGWLAEPEAAPIAVGLHARHQTGEQQLELQASLGPASTRVELRLPDDIALPDSAMDALERISAAVFIDAPAFELGGFEYGPLRLDAQLRDGRLSLPVLELDLPGLRLRRREPSDRSEVAARLEVESLASAARALHALSGRELPALSGHGELELALSGPLGAAQARLNGTLREIVAGASGARSLSLALSAQPFGGAAPPPAHLRLHAESLELKGHLVGPVTVEAQTSDGGRFTLSAVAGSAPELRIRAEGQRVADEPALRLEVLTLSHSSTTWELTPPPAWLRWGGGVGIELALQSGEQRIELALQKHAGQLRLRAALANVRVASLLAPLPESVLGRRAVGGMLDAQLVAERSASAAPWTGDAHVALSQGRWGSVRGVSLALDARAKAGHAQGSFQAEALSGRARGRFELPAQWPPPEGAALRADARVVGLRLGALWRALGRQALPQAASDRIRSVSGALAARAQVDGAWPTPKLTARLEIDAGALRLTSGERYRDIELTVDATPDWVSIHPLVIHSGDGRLELSGHAARHGSGLRFELEARGAGGFPVPMAPLLVANATVTAAGTLSGRQLNLTLTSSNARVVDSEARAVTLLDARRADPSSK